MEHAGNLLRFDDHRRDVGLALGHADGRREETVGFAASSVETKIAHGQIPLAPGVGMVILIASHPTFKTLLIEVVAAASLSMATERFQNELRPLISITQGALVVEKSGDPVREA
jgi:hypothetical protein